MSPGPRRAFRILSAVGRGSTRRGRALVTGIVLALVAATAGWAWLATSQDRGAEGLIAFVTERDGADPEIWTMRADGTDLRQLTRNDANDVQPAWSPDGSRLAFSSGRGDDAQIYVMMADGSGLRRVTDRPGVNGAPAWSPDGRRIAFAGDQMTPGHPFDDDIFVIDADGSGLRRLVGGTGQQADPAWSPDGELVLYSSAPPGGARGLATTGPDGGGPAFPLAVGLDVRRPSWSPDGRRVAYDDDTGLAVLDGLGARPARLTSAGGLFADYDPAWSPDGAEVTFVSDRDGPPGNEEIYLVPAGGGPPRRLTEHPESDREPAWQPIPPPADNRSERPPLPVPVGVPARVGGWSFTVLASNIDDSAFVRGLDRGAPSVTIWAHVEAEPLEGGPEPIGGVADLVAVGETGTLHSAVPGCPGSILDLEGSVGRPAQGRACWNIRPEDADSVVLLVRPLEEGATVVFRLQSTSH